MTDKYYLTKRAKISIISMRVIMSMLINISDVPLMGKKPVFFEELVIVDDNRLSNKEIAVCFAGNIFNGSNIFLLEGTAKAEISAICDKCLEPVSFHLEYEVSEKYGQEEIDGEVWPVSDEKINCETAMEMNLFMNWPMRILCGESCKGLCPSCGCNRNKTECNCDNNQVDSRFDILKNFFQ